MSNTQQTSLPSGNQSSTSAKGPRYCIRHKNPALFYIYNAMNQNSLYNLNIEDMGKLVKIYTSDGEQDLVYKIKSSTQLSLWRKSPKSKDVESSFDKIGSIVIKHEDADNKILLLKIEDEKYGSNLTVSFSKNGSEFTVERDTGVIAQFESFRGPVGKSGGSFKISTGEKKNFMMAVISFIYIAQVSFPRKESLFRWVEPIARYSDVKEEYNQKLSLSKSTEPKKRTFFKKLTLSRKSSSEGNSPQPKEEIEELNLEPALITEPLSVKDRIFNSKLSLRERILNSKVSTIPNTTDPEPPRRAKTERGRISHSKVKGSKKTQKDQKKIPESQLEARRATQEDSSPRDTIFADNSQPIERKRSSSLILKENNNILQDSMCWAQLETLATLPEQDAE